MLQCCQIWNWKGPLWDSVEVTGRILFPFAPIIFCSPNHEVIGCAARFSKTLLQLQPCLCVRAAAELQFQQQNQEPSCTTKPVYDCANQTNLLHPGSYSLYCLKESSNRTCSLRKHPSFSLVLQHKHRAQSSQEHLCWELRTRMVCF